MAMNAAVLEQAISVAINAEPDKSCLGVGRVAGDGHDSSLGTDGIYNNFFIRGLAKAIVSFIIANAEVNVTVETGPGVPGTGLGTIV